MCGSIKNEKCFMLNKINVTKLNFLPGCSAGLIESTAIVEIQYESKFDDFSASAEKWLKALNKLCPCDPMWGIEKDGWPNDFVIKASHNQQAVFANWIIATTIAFQRWARQPVWKGNTLLNIQNTIRLAIPYANKAILKESLEHAFKLLTLWGDSNHDQKNIDQAELKFSQWLKAAQAVGLPPNSIKFYLSARKKGMYVRQTQGFLQIGQGANMEWLDSSFTGRTSNISTRIAKNKLMSLNLLKSAGMPVPASFIVSSYEAAERIACTLGWPVVIKPSNQDQGLGVVPGITNLSSLKTAFDQANKYSPKNVMIEKHIYGNDHRMLVVGGELKMTVLREPGGVVGDGVSSVQKLLEQVNSNPLRGSDKRSLLIRIELDDQALDCLNEQELTPESVPDAGRLIYLRRTANISTGGTPVDVTEIAHPDNKKLAERAARTIGLDIAGVDFICPDITKSWREVGGAICEVNAQPGFRVHWLAAPERDINGEILDWLFKNKPNRIPTAAITGTNGKSTVARMLHHIWRAAGKNTGVCTTQGVWVGDDLVSSDNLSGYPGAQMLLNDPSVEAAVIEMPRKGLLVFGHPCDYYDIAALINIQDDHIGVDGIQTLDQMALLKSQVINRARNAVVINADDERCIAVATKSQAIRKILVARSINNQHLQQHLQLGGDCVHIVHHKNEDWIALSTGKQHQLLIQLSKLPATMNGVLKFNEINALFAIALAWGQGLAFDVIAKAMTSFSNSFSDNPGRYNFIEGLPFKVLLDFGHNPDGVREVCNLVSRLDIKGERHLLTLDIGNRHRSHIQELAPNLAQTFQHFVIGCDSDFVKKSSDYQCGDPVQKMLDTFKQDLLSQGVSENSIQCMADKKDAIKKCLESVKSDDLLVMLVEPWLAIDALKKRFDLV